MKPSQISVVLDPLVNRQLPLIGFVSKRINTSLQLRISADINDLPGSLRSQAIREGLDNSVKKSCAHVCILAWPSNKYRSTINEVSHPVYGE